MSVIIATTKPWNIRLAKEYQSKCIKRDDVYVITEKSETTYDHIEGIQPEYIFFPHWSWIIPPEIFENFCCVVFHMTDLPFGRGGSPLQNLISRGITETKISAIRVNAGIDTGDVYMKCDLSLYGSAEEIYMRAAERIYREMIPYIIANHPRPEPQTGPPTTFKRRSPDMSQLSSDMTMTKLFDYIRMLDAEGYPKAFLRFGDYKLDFSRAKITENGIVADVLIYKEENNER